MFEAVMKYGFLQNAVIASMLVSVICGVIGVIVTEKKLLMMSGGIAHTAYGGVGLGYLLGFKPLWGAALFACAAALSVSFVRKNGGGRSDVTIAVFWSLGMALGVLFVGMTPGYPPDMTSYLFGNILSVTKSDLVLTAVVMLAVLASAAIFFNDWKAFLFDREFAEIGGLNTAFFDNLLMLLIALSVVALIRAVGIMLVIALLTAPAAAASLLSKTLVVRMLFSAALCLLFCLSGLYVSYGADIPSGAAIVIISAAVYAVCYCVRYLTARKSASGF